MNHAQQIARHFRGMHEGPSLTGACLRDILAGVTWQQATTQVHSLNTIASLVFHINYYVAAVRRVLEGGNLDAHDKYSFDAPPIESTQDWQRCLDKLWDDAEAVAKHIEELPDHRIWETMADEKYGNWYHNLHGLIEHTHYHMGQISLVKKIVSGSATP